MSDTYQIFTMTYLDILISQIQNQWRRTIVCIGVSTTPQKYQLPLFHEALPPHKSVNCPSPHFLGNSPLCIGFSWILP